MTNFSLKQLILIALLFSGLVFHSCRKTQKQQVSTSSEFVVDGYIITPQPFENRLKVNANLLPAEYVEIKSPVAGTVLDIFFKEGQHIEKGEPLIQIDDRTWKAQVKGLEVQLNTSREDLRRREALLEAEGVSIEEVETTRSTVLRLEANIEELEVSISLANVRAPFSGDVGMRDFSIGAYMSQGQAITRIAQTNPIKIDFNLPSHYISQIKVGKTVNVLVNQDSIKASIYAVNPVIDENARTIQARAMVNNYRRWMPGDFAEVVVILDSHKSAIVVPSELIVPELGEETVFVVKKGIATKKIITTGARNNRFSLVTSGLVAGDTLLATGLIQIRDGMNVKINDIIKP